MGIVKNSISVLAVTLVMSAAANAATYTPADDTWESELCAAAATSSTLTMHSKISDIRTSVIPPQNYKLIANHLFCNNMNVVQWANSTGNTEVADKLDKLRSRHVEIQDITKVYSGAVHVGSK